MGLVSACWNSFSSRDRHRGVIYFQRGRVGKIHREGKLLVTEVRGSSPKPYQLALDDGTADDGVLRVRCSCPRFGEVGACKHLWAFLWALDDKEILGGRIPAELLLQPLNLPQARSATATPTRSAAASARASQPPPPARSWQRELTRIPLASSLPASASRQVPDHSRYRHRVHWVVDVARSEANQGVFLTLFVSRVLRDDTNSAPRHTQLGRIDLQQVVEADDQALLRFFRRWAGLGNYTSTYGYGYASAFLRSRGEDYLQVAPELYESLLPRLSGTSRFHWLLDNGLDFSDSHPLTYDASHVCQFQLHVTADDERGLWELQGRLLPDPAAPARPLEDAVLILPGLVMFPDRLVPLDSRFLPWIQALRRTAVIEIPYSERAGFLEHLAQRPGWPEIKAPDNFRWVQETVCPTARLRIKPQTSVRRYWPAEIWFDYGPYHARPDSVNRGWYQAEADRMCLRDPGYENTRLAELRQALQSPDFGQMSVPQGCDVCLPDLKLLDILARLHESGWKVEAEGRPIRRAGDFNIQVNSGIDWFDVDAQLDFGGVAAKLPELLAVLRKGEKVVVLDDGSLGLLPEEWLKRYQRWAELAEEQDGVLRFQQSQSLLLDALLAAESTVQVDAEFARRRRELAKFRGVGKREPARSFRGELRDYQKEGLGWLQFLEKFGLGGCLADDMGLGKTVQVLAHLVTRRARRPAADRRPSLVVVPKSLVFNWLQEATRFTPRLNVLDYTGTERKGRLSQCAEYDLLVTTYGTLRRDILDLKEVPFDYVLLDEAQAIKNARSQSAKACRLLRADHRLAMSGTPVENHLGELWSLFEFLNPGLLGRCSGFQELTGKSTPDPEAVEFLARALRPYFLRRTKEQVLAELPEKTEQTVYCELSAKERRLYNELRDYYRDLLGEKIEQSGLEQAKIHVLEALLRLRQAACHPGLLDKARQGESSAKLDALLEQVSEVLDEGHKALVFSQFTSLLAILRQRLDALGLSYEYLDGQTRNRRVPIERFQNHPDSRLFLISLKAGGLGLNLTAADYVFILDPWWNPAVEAQAIDRAHRIGQTNRVFAYRLIARDTVEEKVLKLQESKRDLAEAIIRSSDSVIRNLTVEDLQLLLS